MKPIRIFRHIDCEGPGYLLEVLSQHKLPIELVRVDQGDRIPPQVDDVAGLVFMGGSMSVNDGLPWIREELAIIRRAVAQDIPVMGHCLGGQLIAKALGASVVTNKMREVGWHAVNVVDTFAAKDWLAGLPPEMLLYHWHGEMFKLPPGAQLILSNHHCENQGFVIGNALAMQCHIEMTESLVREWAQRFADQLHVVSESEQDVDQMLAELPQRVANLNQYANRIYRRWLEPILRHA